MNVKDIILTVTEKIFKVSGSTFALARLLKIKPADLAEAIMDKNSNDAYMSTVVSYATGKAVVEAQEQEADNDKE
jgi:hypothetical protein